MNSSDLYSRIAAGEDDAFREVLRLYKARLLYYGKRFLKDWDEVEDIVAEAFLKLWQHRQQLLSDAHMKNFLYVTVRHKALNLIDSQHRYEKMLGDLATGADPAEDVYDPEMIEEEMMTLLDQAILSLPPECRRIFELSWEEQKTPAEIALLLNMNPATVRSQKRRAIQLIQAWIQKNGRSALLIVSLLLTIQFYFQKKSSYRLHDVHSRWY